jgi:hypothetical protein
MMRRREAGMPASSRNSMAEKAESVATRKPGRRAASANKAR